MKMSAIRTELGGLPSKVGAEDLHRCAVALARAAAAKQHPLKSLAAFRRHSRGVPHLDDVVDLALRELAALDERQPLPEAPMPGTRWLSVDAVAALLPGTSVRTVKERLRTRNGRRSYGWAWWDGSRWLIPEPAINPATRAGYMATLPHDEPEAHVAALPGWCDG